MSNRNRKSSRSSSSQSSSAIIQQTQRSLWLLVLLFLCFLGGATFGFIYSEDLWKLMSSARQALQPTAMTVEVPEFVSVVWKSQ